MLSFSIPQNHPSIPGHFPGNPIVPGVLLLARVMAYAQSQANHPLEHFALLNVKFLAAVAPGDKLNVTFSEANTNGLTFAVHIAKSNAESNDVLACTGQLRQVAD